MPSVVKIESFDVDVTAINTQTHTLTTSVVDIAKAFVRRTTSIDKQSGPTGSTADAAPNIANCAAVLTGTTTVSFYQNTTTSQKVIGEVWRFTGASGDPDEFIVRGRYSIALSATTASQAVTGITDVNNCVPFITGISNPNTLVTDYDASAVGCYMDASDNIQLERGVATGTLTVYVTVVEFVGGNWSVGHGISTNHDTNDQVVTLNTSSTGTGGTTFDVGSWNRASIIEGSLEGDTAETGLSDNLGCWTPEAGTSEVKFVFHQDSAARNDGNAYCHVIVHPGIKVNRNQNTNIAEGNGTYATNAAWPSGASTTEAIDELALEWFSDTSGTGTAHARGRLSARITAATGTISYWVHRSGNNVIATWAVIELAGVDGTDYLLINDIDTDEAVTNSQLNVIISGKGFGATQGTGKVELVQNENYTGTIISQSIDSWADTSIQIDITSGALSDTKCFLFVTNDSASSGYLALSVGTPPETYTEALTGLNPSHLWGFQNSYNDPIGGATANSTSGGTPTFSATRQLCKGDTHSLQLDISDYISPADQSDMNTTALTRRYMGGWIQLDSIHQVLSVLYEEGAQINNIAMLLGFGNILMAQCADTGDDYVQAYSDFTLAVDRPYHILFKFEANAYDSEYRLYVDGILQTKTNGNPWTPTDLDSHSGNISWGHEGTEALEVGGTDILFASPNVCNYAQWANWTGVSLTTATIRQELFEKGAPASITISSDTEANMQTALDAYASTTQSDAPCVFEIEKCTAGSFSLDFDNITFNSRCSIEIRYVGSDTLTAFALNGTALDSSKLSTPYSGTITVITPAVVTITGFATGSDITVLDGTTILDAKTNQTAPYTLSVQTSPVNIVIIHNDFNIVRLEGVVSSSDITVPIVQDQDRVYSNP